MAKLTLKKYIELSKTINCLDDIEINKVSLNNIFELVDDDGDKIRGRGIIAIINKNTSIEWFEKNDKIIAYATLMENKNHIQMIKNKIFDLLCDRLFMFFRINDGINYGVDYNNIDFVESNKLFNKLRHEK